jgi:hypothetical protein
VPARTGQPLDELLGELLERVPDRPFVPGGVTTAGGLVSAALWHGVAEGEKPAGCA